MRADDVRLDNTEPECSVLRHHLVDLRDGVLPEMLGLGFLAIIFCGFAATYLIAGHAS